MAQKVASAWSRQNLPPPELDKMFRNIESIYKANRGLLTVSPLCAALARHFDTHITSL